jgi:hypothetical protein
MNNWKTALAVALLLAGTLGAGAMHGQMSGRWGLRETGQQAAEQLLMGLPSEVGNWRLRHEDKLAPDVVKVLQCPAHIIRVYEHQQTGDVATVAVLLGPPGPISVHTPEICYSSRDFTISGDRRTVSISANSGANHAFWELPLKTNNVHATPLRVMYAWSAGTQWEAAKYPRFEFGGLSHLYKLQVAVTKAGPVKSSEFDAGRDFLVGFVDQLQPRLMEARMPGGLVQ